MKYNNKLCEDEDDAARMSEAILRYLGYNEVQKGNNIRDIQDKLSNTALLEIARYAERIARWARRDSTHK